MKNVIELTSVEVKNINGGTNGVYDDGTGNGGCTGPFHFPKLIVQY